MEEHIVYLGDPAGPEAVQLFNTSYQLQTVKSVAQAEEKGWIAESGSFVFAGNASGLIAEIQQLYKNNPTSEGHQKN